MDSSPNVRYPTDYQIGTKVTAPSHTGHRLKTKVGTKVTTLVPTNMLALPATLPYPIAPATATNSASSSTSFWYCLIIVFHLSYFHTCAHRLTYAKGFGNLIV